MAVTQKSFLKDQFAARDGNGDGGTRWTHTGLSGGTIYPYFPLVGARSLGRLRT